jgi:hypothetical protein
MKSGARLALPLVVGLLLGCGSRPHATPGSTDGGMTGLDAAMVGDDGGGIEVPDPPGEVFANSRTAFYRLDLQANTFGKVADFQGCDGIQDIAVDGQGNMYAASFTHIWAVDRTTGQCTGPLISASNLFAISFVPKGTVDPNKEVLVGYTKSDYLEIDLATRGTRRLGSLQLPYQISGDFVAVKGHTYASLIAVGGSGSFGGDCDDCLAEVDNKTGVITKTLGSIGDPYVSGLAYWKGSVYAFCVRGNIFRIDLPAFQITDLTHLNPDFVGFYGAGSTTAAPVPIQ